MPIYEYRCEACGHRDEHLQKVSDAPLTKCPECGKAKYRKQLSAAGFQLKGTGWYATDFRGGTSSSGAKPADKKAGESKAADAKGEKEKKGDAKSEAKSSDSKPESKAAA